LVVLYEAHTCGFVAMMTTTALSLAAFHWLYA
jgi:hypothetical protein